MAQGRFSRRSEGGGNIPEAPEARPEQGRKGLNFGSFTAKAKEVLGNAAGSIKGVFGKDGTGEKVSRTAEPDAPFEAPPMQPQPAQRFTPAAAPELVDYSDFDDIPQAEQQPADYGAYTGFAETPQSQPEAAPMPEAAPESQPQPSFRRRSAADDRGLPSRWDARQRGGELYFSDRMTDEGFRVKDTVEQEPKKRPEYHGEVVGLAKGYDGDDGSEHFYTPNIEVGDENQRRRYKKRNRKPLKFWQKATITGVCITAAFIGLIFLTINLMLIGKMNHMDTEGSKDMNDLYFYTPQMVTSILDDSLSMNQDDRTRLTSLNDAFALSDLALKSDKKVQNFLCVALDKDDNADAMVIISIDEKTKKVRLVNILPDMYVPLADQIDSISYGSSLRKIYAYGGADMLRDTLEDTLRVKIDNYFVIGFTAFETAVNHLGGADITITEEYVSRWLATNKHSPQPRFGGTGRFTLNGEEALIYARMSDPDGIFIRAQRQQEIFTKLCDRLSDYGTLDLVSALYNALSYVTTDCSASKMLGLCGKLNGYGDYEVKGVTVPIQGTYSEGYVGGSYLLASNITVNANDIQLFLYSNDMTFADGGMEVNVLLPEVSAVLDVPKAPVSASDISPSDAA